MGFVLTVRYCLRTDYQFVQECFWLSRITQLCSSEDPVCQPSISSYELYFLFQFHRKEEVPASFVPIHSSIHTCADQFSSRGASRQCTTVIVRAIVNVTSKIKTQLPEPVFALELNFPLKQFQLCMTHKTVCSKPQQLNY